MMQKIKRLKSVLLSVGIIVSCLDSMGQEAMDFWNINLPVDKRIENLLSQLTLEEKISLLGFDNNGVPRLNIPAYNWWNESLHGVARAGEATIFPQAIGMAATFNDNLINQVADVISTEARAKYNLSTSANRRLQYMGLTFWSPNINIFRDPRWGRGQETYGEDPFLTSKIGAAYVRGIQGNDSNYLKATACAKHYAVHSGPEADRHTFNVVVDEKDLRETYLYAFNKLVDAGVESIMCAYNQVNKEPCCTSNTLLKKILLDEWKFNGHIVTDCGALYDIWKKHKVMNSGAEVAAAAIKAGISVDCSNLLQNDVIKAVNEKLLTEKEIDQALIPAFRTQFKLGFYDRNAATPFSNYGSEEIHNTAHVELSRKVAQQSMVLLKNNYNLLPLDKSKYGTILVTGPNSVSVDALLGNYHGLSSNLVTFAEGITKAVGPEVGLQYDLGCNDTDTTRFGGLWVSENSDLTIAVIGLNPVVEGEEGDAFLAPHGGDRVSLSIPKSHIAFLKALRNRHKKPIIAIITSGSAVNISEIESYADAIILAWYPGEQGGNALADILFGKVSPSGKLPVTFYKSLDDLPPYESYKLSGRTYRYFEGKVQYPFGFGLSYTSFTYETSKPIEKTYNTKDTINIDITIKNIGAYDADEVVQAYVSYPTMERAPIKELKAFNRASVKAMDESNVTLSIPVSDLQKWSLKNNRWEVVKGDYAIFVGSNSEDKRMTYSFKIK